MDNEKVKITPQDIIDREFRVKFRGFDMAEVDAFLEEVAESFFQLAEENTLLNEKILALQQDLETAVSQAPQGPAELPPELGNTLEDLKQDTAAISAELTVLKQDRQTFDAIKTRLEKIITAVQESRAAMAARSQVEFPADLADRLEEFTRNSTAIAGELAALKEDRQVLDSFKKSFEEIIQKAKEAAASITPQGQVELPADLGKTLENFTQGSQAVGAELAALKEGIGALAGIRDEIGKELQKQLSSHFKTLEAKFSPGSPQGGSAAPAAKAAPAAPGKKEALLTAEIIEEPEGREQEDETSLPDYRKFEEASAEGELEFLSEDDILDVDKLRGIFQSVLDEGPDEGHAGREGEEEVADLLFLEEDFIEDGPEPEVTFSLEEHEPDRNEKFRKK
jgi:cell division initiation protein